MADGFEKMAEEGIPQTTGPKVVEDKKAEAQKALPKLSMAEFKRYNRMADHMNYFHEHFRQTWNLLYNACVSGKRPMGMSLKTFLSTGEQLAHHITVHHTIEEQHVYPMLAPRMPAFRENVELLKQHEEIHEGLEKLEAYLRDCRRGEKEFRMEELRKVMEGFGEVLWVHMDDEVRELGAEEMRKYWSLQEVERMVM